MECPICFNIIANSAIGSCTHHFCFPCLIKWCEYGGTRCPTCKLPITQIRLDQEFDSINNSDNFSTINNCCSEIIVKFDKNSLAGITLENNCDLMGFGSRGPGVRVSKIHESYQCYKNGLRKKDVILFINNIPCTDHKQAIDIINNCAISTALMKCSLLKQIKINSDR